jgi:WD40-like Beta Propeller Repeat
MRHLRGPALFLLLTGAALLGGAPAQADVFGPVSLLSASPLVQGEWARDPVISGNGRYVAFQGSVGGVLGVWRREIRQVAVEERPGEEKTAWVGGALEQVAGGDAELPSISETGQYVSFDSNEGSELPAITDELPNVNESHESPNVFVRNMAIAPSGSCQGGERCAFTLASAASGPEGEAPKPLDYGYADRETEEENRGSIATGRTAISADGSRVAFVTTAESDLAGPGTPRLQVAVRDIDTNKTELVSVRYDRASGKPALNPETGEPEPVPSETARGNSYGAVFTPGGSPPLFGAGTVYQPTVEIGASISADGSTVAWLGQDVGAQVPTLSGEPLPGFYSAPLWRRIDEGSGVPTRQVTGGADPTAPGCEADPEARLPEPPSTADPCQGPFRIELGSEGIVTGAPATAIPRLSSNGDLVAFLATDQLVSLGNDFGSGEANRPADAYVANMAQGLTRSQALEPLTELAGAENTVLATDAPILDIGISPDGSQVAFTTQRTQFPLGSPGYVSAPAAQPGLAELYDVDLAQDTLTRVSRGYVEGTLSEQPGGISVGVEDPYVGRGVEDGALSPSFSANGELLAFSSTASNLLFGDGNTPIEGQEGHLQDGSDVFLTNRIAFPSAPTAQLISPAPAGPEPSPLWTLSATAVSQSNGTVRIYVEVPGAGTLKAQAASAVKVRVREAGRAGTRGKGAKGAKGSPGAVSVENRTVASASRPATEANGGLETVVLSVAHAYRALAEDAGGLYSVAKLTFIAAGHPALHESIPVRFSIKPSPPTKARRATRSRAAGHRRGA